MDSIQTHQQTVMRVIKVSLIRRVIQITCVHVFLRTVKRVTIPVVGTPQVSITAHISPFTLVSIVANGIPVPIVTHSQRITRSFPVLHVTNIARQEWIASIVDVEITSMKAMPVTIVTQMEMIKMLRAFTCLILCLLCSPLKGSANGDGNMVNGKIVQLAGKTIYVDVGRSDGWQEQQELVVYRGGVQVGKVQIVRLADRFCACEQIAGKKVLRIGDEVQGVGAIDADQAIQSEGEDLGEGNRSARKKERPQQYVQISDEVAHLRTQVRGKVAVRYTFSDDKSESNHDVHQPSVRMNFDVDHIAGTGFGFNVRVRARKKPSSTSQHPILRLYDLGVHYQSANEALKMGVGRLSPGEVSGVGEFDGGLFQVKIASQMKVGVFGGFQPQQITSGFDSNAHKAGAYVNWDRSGWGSLRQNTTLAFVGEYQNGQIDREYFYFQNFLWFGRTISLFQHVAVDLNRGNQAPSRKKIDFHNAYTSLRISPSSHLTLSVGYDARNQHTMPMYDSPEDSLLVVAFRQGLQGDIRFRPLKTVSFFVRGNMRFQKGKERSRAWSTGGSVRDILRSGFRLRGRFTNIVSSFGQSKDFGVGLAKDIGQRLLVDTEWGRYHSQNAQFSDMRQRLTGRVQIFLPRRTFLNVEHTYYSGSFKRAFTFVELSARY